MIGWLKGSSLWLVVIAALLSLAVVQRGQLQSALTARAQDAQRHAETLRNIAVKAQQAAEAVARYTNENAQRIGKLDQQLSEATREKIKANRARDAALAAGAQRLYFAGAKCPAGGGAMPDATATARMDDGAAVEVTDDARRAVSDLRQALIEDAAKIEGLQGYIQAACRGAP